MSFDAPEANRAFRDKQRFPFALLSDTTREMALAYGACASRKAWFPDRITYIIDAEGRIGTINRAAQRLFGVPESPSPIGRKLDEAVARRELVEQRVTAVEQGEEPAPRPKRPARREGWARPDKPRKHSTKKARRVA